MGKKRSKKSATFADRLVQALEKGDAGDLASQAPHEGMTEEQFNRAFDTAAGLANRGPDPRQVAELPPPFQVAFLKLAEAEEDDEQVNDLISMTADKNVKKEAKRVLHRLRSRGLQVEADEETGPSVLERRVAQDEPELPCYLTPVTSTGMRMVVLASFVRGGVGIYQVEINDQDGLQEFEGGVIGRSRYRELAKDMLKSQEASMVEISYGEARARIARAVERSRAAGRALPDGYLEASSNLPDPKEESSLPDPRADFADPSLGEDRELLTASASLHDHPAFGDWMPDEDVLQSFQEKLKEIESGQIAINESQKIEQVGNAMDRAVEQTLEGDRRRVYQDRLFEMATWLKRAGEDQPARQAAAAAWQLEREDVQPLDSPFFSHLVKKMFKSPEEIVKAMTAKQSDPQSSSSTGDESDSGNLIVPG